MSEQSSTLLHDALLQGGWSLRREIDTLVATETKNLAFLNMREILYPPSEFDLLIYNRLAREIRDGTF